MPARRPLRLLPLGCAVLVLLATAGRADVLKPKSGKAVTGAIVRKTDSEVVFNIYWSRNPDVVNPEHLIRLPLGKVKKVEEQPRPGPELWRRWKAAKTPDEYVAAGTYAKEHKLKAEARVCFACALARDDAHKEAIKGIGGRAKWDSVRKGNPLLDAELQAMLERYVAEGDPAERARMQRALHDKGFRAKDHELERWRRGMHQTLGYQEDRPISYRSDARPGAVYTLFVPEEYTPARTWPLIIGLHGGGPGGKRGDEVVGSGPSAMNFYRRNAGKYGYLVACPTGIVAGWGNPVNESFVRDLITELRLLYHVDIDRIYLTGHSMGGFGTWALGPRLAEDLAAISPMAGGGGGVGRLVATRTPIFIFHGADDRVVGPASDRSQAKQLLGTTHDFVYTELDKVGHGFPASVQTELFEFFEPRRRYDKKYKEAWPRSSFEGKVTKEEVLYLGDPMAEIRGDAPALKDWLAHMRLGGGRALSAVARFAEQKPDGAVAGLCKILGSGSLPFDGRAYAARALGLLGSADALPALRKAVALPAERDFSMLARECALALVALKDAEGTQAIGKAIAAWTDYYESKVAGDGMDYSDWIRATATLASLAEAWAALASPDAKRSVIEKSIVQRVFLPNHQVATSERVPQDPSRTRIAMAAAVAHAYKKTNASADAWDALLRALEGAPKARSAAEALRP